MYIIVVRRVFLPEEEGERAVVSKEKGAISANGPRGAGRINTLRSLLLWGYGIAIAAFTGCIKTEYGAASGMKKRSTERPVHRKGAFKRRV